MKKLKPDWTMFVQLPAAKKTAGRIENEATRVEAARRQLSRLIVATGALRSDPLVVRRDGDIVLYATPTTTGMELIQSLATQYEEAMQAEAPSPWDNPEFRTIDSLIRANGDWGHGRTRRVLPTGTGDNDDDDDRAGGQERIGLDAAAAVARDYTASKGWHATKKRAARPPGQATLTTRKATVSALEELAPLVEIRVAIRAGRYRTPSQGRLYRLTATTLRHRVLSTKHAAASLEVSERTIRKMKADTNGGDALFQVLEELHVLRCEIADMKETTEETRRTVLASAELLRGRFPSDEDVSAAVDIFIAGIGIED